MLWAYGKRDDSFRAGGNGLALLGEGEGTDDANPRFWGACKRGVVAGRGKGGAKAFRLDLVMALLADARRPPRFIARSSNLVLAMMETGEDPPEPGFEAMETEGERVPRRSGASLGRTSGADGSNLAGRAGEASPFPFDALKAAEKGLGLKSTSTRGASSFPPSSRARPGNDSGVVTEVKLNG